MGMKITNRLGFPEWLHDVLRWCFGQYERGAADFTVTELAQPVTQRTLMRKHEDEVEQDISQIVDLVIGKAVHLFFETALKTLGIEHIEFEKRITATYSVGGKLVTVSGQYDAYDTKTRTLWDFKVVKSFAAKMGPKPDYIAQLNTYADLMERTGKPGPKALKNLYIIKDWSADDAARDPEYPQAPLIIIEIPLMTPVDRAAWVVGRIGAHQVGTAPCSSEEMWERPGKNAVMRIGRKSALKLFDPEQKAEAEAFAKANGGFVETRKGRRIRCERYCAVSKFCSDWQAFNKDVKEVEA